MTEQAVSPLRRRMVEDLLPRPRVGGTHSQDYNPLSAHNKDHRTGLQARCSMCLFPDNYR
jgi:hypothetical protein